VSLTKADLASAGAAAYLEDSAPSYCRPQHGKAKRPRADRQTWLRSVLWPRDGDIHLPTWPGRSPPICKKASRPTTTTILPMTKYGALLEPPFLSLGHMSLQKGGFVRGCRATVCPKAQPVRRRRWACPVR